MSPRDERDLSQIPEGVRLFARIEHMVGEEGALLAIPPEKRSKEQHERLHAITRELDQIWEKLRERADRLTAKTPSSH
jgi:hypothetical protein